MKSPAHRDVQIDALRDAGGVRRTDAIAVEEPLEIRVMRDGLPEADENGGTGRSISVTMRTPGHDAELALGVLHGEGVIRAPRDVVDVGHCGSTGNVIRVTVRADLPLDLARLQRNFYTTSSCGVCGKGALEEVAVSAPLAAEGPAIARELLAGLPDRLRQPTFERTGGLHATGLFTPDGTLLQVREDVGRHNAMDKVIGWALRQGVAPLHPNVLCVSGRLSFELVQKAAVAHAPILVGVGAPSSLAIRLASDRAMTLAGFAREGRVNVYTGVERVT